MRKFVAAVVLAALSACGRHVDQSVKTVTIYAPTDTHFVRTIRFDARANRIEVADVGEAPAWVKPFHPFPKPPIDSLRWVSQNGGFNQPIQKTAASEIVGVRVTFANAPPLETRFAGAWDVNEPPALQSVQSWYERALFSASATGSGWHHALAYTIKHRRVRAIRFIEPGHYTLILDQDGTAHIAVGRGKRMRYATGRVDPRALNPIYEAALGLSPKAPVYAADDPPMHVEIIGQHRTYVAVGSNDPGLQLFAARMDQLAHDIHWNKRIQI